MSWECACGVSNNDKSTKCAGCGWTREELQEYLNKSGNDKILADKILIKFNKVYSFAWEDIVATKKYVIIFVISMFIIREASGYLINLSTYNDGSIFNKDKLIIIIISYALQGYLYCGLLNISILNNRSNNIKLSNLFISLDHTIRTSIVGTASIILFGIGMVLLFVPGIIIALMLSQSIPLILDNKANLFDSYKTSYKMTKEFKGAIFFALLPIGIIGSLTQLLYRPTSYNFLIQDSTGLQMYIILVGLSLLYIIQFVLMAYTGGYIYNRLLANILKESIPSQSYSVG
jgi:hypothetical protein